MTYSVETKRAVLLLVKSGRTYSEIQKEFTVPKSTISNWVTSEGIIHNRTRQFEHLAKARIKAVHKIHCNKNARLALAEDNANKELLSISLENVALQKAFLSMLYWAEGSKSPKSGAFTFVNTDPVLLTLYVTMLRNTYPIEEGRFRIGLQIHKYHNLEEVTDFWSELLKIPKSQFWKIYVKKRSEHKKFRRNFRGMCSIYYGKKAIREELLAFGRLLAQNISLSSVNG